MKYVFFALILTGCLPPSVGEECQSDLDCKGDRVCEDAECVDPNTTDDGSINPTGGNECGVTVIDCNCEAVQAYDGQVFPTDECNSGYVMVTTQGCYQQCYTATWQAVCAC